MIDDSKKPLVFTVIVAGVALAVSTPLAYIVGAFVTILTGTVPETVGQDGGELGIVAGLLTAALVVAYASYATYGFSKAKYVDGTVE